MINAQTILNISYLALPCPSLCRLFQLLSYMQMYVARLLALICVPFLKNETIVKIGPYLTLRKLLNC